MRPIPREMVEKVQLARYKGMSIPEITNALDISKTSVWRITHGLVLAPEVYQVIKSKRGGSHARRKQNELLAFSDAESILAKSFSDSFRPLLLASLYWAEGTKSSFVFTNTDSKMIKVFVDILRKDFKVSDDRFQIFIRIGDSTDVKEILSHWATVLGVPVSTLRVNINPKYNKTTVKYGLCRITIARGGQLLKMVMSLNHQLAEKILNG